MLSIVASLIFLALEVRQSNLATLIDARDSAAQGHIEYLSLGIDTDTLMHAIEKTLNESPVELTGLEKLSLETMVRVLWRHYEHSRFRGKIRFEERPDHHPRDHLLAQHVHGPGRGSTSHSSFCAPCSHSLLRRRRTVPATAHRVRVDVAQHRVAADRVGVLHGAQQRRATGEARCGSRRAPSPARRREPCPAPARIACVGHQRIEIAGQHHERQVRVGEEQRG
jgi:hypothetical protein